MGTAFSRQQCQLTPSPILRRRAAVGSAVANREVVGLSVATAADLSPAATASRSRPLSRRQGLIVATRELLRKQGWHSVSIGDIGEAAGITGPAVYRHFKNKEDLLVAVLKDAADQLWCGVEDEEHATPAAVLEAYVDSHIAFAINNAEIVELWYQNSPHLPEPSGSAQRRLQRGYIERWNDALLALYPQLPPDEGRLMVRAAVGLIHSIVHSDGVFDSQRLATILRRMVLSALEAAATETEA